MQRFKNKSDIIIGSVILFDNVTGFIKTFPKVKLVGEIKEVSTDNDNILVAFKIAGHLEFKEEYIPFYLAQ